MVSRLSVKDEKMSSFRAVKACIVNGPLTTQNSRPLHTPQEIPGPASKKEESFRSWGVQERPCVVKKSARQ
jgi:hypothetical protein